MKPMFVSHESYQTFVLDQLQKHYSEGVLTLVKKDWTIISTLWLADLSHTITWLVDSYPGKGPAPRDPACMLRSYLLFLITNPTIGITKWVDEMYRVPLYAILSGFEPKDIPGVGTFYVFLSDYGAVTSAMVNHPSNQNGQKRKRKTRKKEKKQPLGILVLLKN